MDSLLRLNIGCEDHRIPGYVGIDTRPTAAADVVRRVPPLPYDAEAVADIYAGHFIEHLAPWEVTGFLLECHRVLAPGGSLTLVFPDAARVRLLADSQILAGPGAARILLGLPEPAEQQHWILWTRARAEAALERMGLTPDRTYDYRADVRVFDRAASWQGGARGVKA